MDRKNRAVKLFIVESPTKAKTISTYLGKQWQVRATLGHIRDLPRDRLGIDEETLRPTFQWVRGKKKLVEKIKVLAQRADSIFIGTDPDREGEAIAYFLQKELEVLNKPTFRVVFYEVTRDAIHEAIQNPTTVNQKLVNAQFARRVLDRLIGYRLSPYLWKALKNNRLSLGRVQSPALRLIVEREREIINFKKTEYYLIKALFEKDGVQFSATWNYRFEKPENARPFLQKLKDAIFEVMDFEQQKEEKDPPRPFITSSLQLTANSRLKLSAEQVQKIAQKLYESGYITYPRTDSHRMNAKRAQEFLSYIEKTHGREYVGRLRSFRERSSSQGSHECIRPTSLKSPPLKGVEFDLYNLIFNRTLASLSTPAILLKSKALMLPVYRDKKGERMEFVAHGVELLFDGYLKFYPEELELSKLPKLHKGELLRPLKLSLLKRQVHPPQRYTEGSLIKKLEDLGIGRPSTYASIVKNLKERGYVYEEKGFLKPAEVAFNIVDFISENFPSVVDYGFTSSMEEGLDSIEEGRKDWKEIVREFFSLITSGQ